MAFPGPEQAEFIPTKYSDFDIVWCLDSEGLSKAPTVFVIQKHSQPVFAGILDQFVHGI